MQVYTKQEVLGSGSYGKVYKGIENATKRIVAIKSFHVQSLFRGVPESFLQQINTLKRIPNHPSIVKLLANSYTISQEESKAELIFEFMDQDLRKFITQHSQEISLQDIRSILYQLVQGLKKAHNSLVIHGDLKPQNILINEHNQIKIADFGLAQVMISPSRDLCPFLQSMFYRAPEIILRQPKYGSQIDCWSLGYKKFLITGDCEFELLLEIFHLCGTPKTKKFNNGEQIVNMKRAFPKFPGLDFRQRFPRLEENGLDLLRKLLTFDPSLRITMDQAAEHPFFQQVPNHIRQKYQ